MNPLPLITAVDKKAAFGVANDLIALRNDNQIVTIALERIPQYLPCDFFCWNEFSNDFSEFYNIRHTSGYEKTLAETFEALVGNLCYHPIVNRVGYSGLVENAYRISNFSSDIEFQNNPLFLDAYRHLDTKYQMGMVIGTLQNKKVLLTLNRKKKDFTDHEMQRLAFLIYQLRPAFQALNHYFSHLESCDKIESQLNTTTGLTGFERLTNSELQALIAIRSCQSVTDASSRLGIRRDTLSKKLAAIAEKVGAENWKSLLAAVHYINSTTNHRPQNT